jgi:hypothetical protein
MSKGWPVLAVIVAALAVLEACTGDSPTAGIDRGGVRTPVTAVGPITGFGSIIVNGVHYAIDDAAIDVDGAVASADDLALGQIVTVVGNRDAAGATGTAESVAAVANVQGPTEAIDALGGALIVLGQRVLTDAGTVLDLDARAPDIGSLVVGELVRVSGFAGTDGTIVATRIELRSPGGELRLLGTVTDLDLARARFRVNDLVVDYSAALTIDGFPTGQPSEGDRVIVVGTSLGSAGELLARELELSGSELQGDEHGEVEVEGLITRFASALDFDVSGLAVTTTVATVYEGGTAANLLLNVKVKVDGPMSPSGQIEARKIEIKDGGRVFGEN